ncbi:sensor histidine kinase [Paenibacillus sp. 481]|uniref:sensor histidine kinase n=1 Tax=Paenibacillus sp. 481 TaxID=2835869 RepID=UPI001E62124C|nr:HAMP domain-containing histidine kinase [Paenibacillus sp. 481]UHA74681.1 HAMP domain-containing protein [Paenibacillus sp. 481]
MRRKITLPFSNIPIKWKLTIWSSLLLFLLLAAYNAVQYIAIEKWMVKQEKTTAQQDMREILNYFLEQEVAFQEEDYTQIRHFLEKMNQQNQLIRILDAKGNPIVVVTEDVSERWLAMIPIPEAQSAGTQYVTDNLLMTRSPLTIFHFNGSIEIVKNMEDFERLSSTIFNVMAIGCLGAILISGLGGRLLARQLLKPLQSMNETMTNIKQKGLHERVQFNDNQDEIATLMKMFNEMMDQVERSFQQQKQFVEDASHELRTPIAIVEGHLKLLQRWGKKDPAVLEESLQASVQELSRLNGLVQELLALTRAEKGHAETNVHLQQPDQAIHKLIKNVAVLHPTFHFEVELHSLADVSLAISETHLEQVLLILLDNAVKYSGASKTIQVRGSLLRDAVSIAIIDFGIGIPEQDLPYVKDRFYRVDKARSSAQGGHGLGLSIAARLVEKYNGAIAICSVEKQGTTVTVTFPLVARHSSPVVKRPF